MKELTVVLVGLRQFYVEFDNLGRQFEFEQRRPLLYPDVLREDSFVSRRILFPVVVVLVPFHAVVELIQFDVNEDVLVLRAIWISLYFDRRYFVLLTTNESFTSH